MIQLQSAMRRQSRDTDDLAAVTAFLGRASFETTRFSGDDQGALAAHAPARTSVYVSEVPARPLADQLAVVEAVRALGFEPVPHLAVRNFSSGAALDAYVGLLVARAGVERVLVIAGDRAEPAGPFRSAVELIESGILQSHGIRGIGIAGYPEGHPRITGLALERALVMKLEAATETGLEAHIVTQFGFSAEPILGWLMRLRDHGIDHPVRLGLPGPTSIATLLRYARICGVRTSAQALARNAGFAKTMFSHAAPDRLVRTLATACAAGRLGDVEPHLYSFGGLAATVRWTAGAAAGRLALDRAGGFSVAPP